MPLASSAFEFAGNTFIVMFVVVSLLIAAAVVFITVAIIRNTRKVRQSGQDPLTLHADLAVKAMNSELLAPSQSMDVRLSELSRLHAAGTITDEEHTKARAAILSGS